MLWYTALYLWHWANWLLWGWFSLASGNEQYQLIFAHMNTLDTADQMWTREHVLQQEAGWSLLLCHRAAGLLNSLLLTHVDDYWLVKLKCLSRHLEPPKRKVSLQVRRGLMRLFLRRFPGACWPSLRSPASAQLLLGGWGLHLQVLRGDPGRPLPQGRQTQPRHPMDHKGCAQAQRDAWPDLCRKEEPRPGQGPQVPPDHRWLPPRRLEETQHPAAAPLSLKLGTHLYIKSLNKPFLWEKMLSVLFILSRVFLGSSKVLEFESYKSIAIVWLFHLKT